MSVQAEQTLPKKEYQGFSFRQRLLPTILVALALGLTLCVIGPLDIFFNNIEEFLFSPGDFAWWSVLFCLVLAGIVCGILLPLKGRAFDIAYAVFFALAVLLFLQGNYLNIGLNSLAGDGLNSNSNQTLITVINTIVWIAFCAGSIVAVLLIKKPHRDLICTVGIIAMITVIGMQTMPLVVKVLTAPQPQTDEGSQGANSVLTYENFNSMGSENNIYYFVVDRFDYSFYENYVLQEGSELFENMDGFTYYSDFLSLYTRTYPAIAYMLTGTEHDFNDARTDYFDEAYSNSTFLKLLKEKSYNLNIYTDDYYGYHSAASMESYVSNSSGKIEVYEVIHRFNLSWDMIRLSLYRYFPFALKSTVGNINTPQFGKYIQYPTEYPKYTSDMKDAYEYLQNNPITATNTEKNFSFIHLAGCHLPVPYDENFESTNDLSIQANPSVGLVQSFKIINIYLERLKELGLYEDATIIISGDHAYNQGSDELMLNDESKSGPFLTALFVKPSGCAGEPLKTSSAPIAQADVMAAILQSENIKTDLDFGRSLFDVSENEVRERKIYFQSQKADGNYEDVVFKVTGSGRDLKNWVIESRGKYVGDIYD